MAVNYITLTRETAYETFYFNGYDVGVEEWEITPEDMIDGDVTTYAGTTIDGDVQLLTDNTAVADTTTIVSVEIRACSASNDFSSPTGVYAYLRPVFGGGDGDNHGYKPRDLHWNEAFPFVWSEWFDITTDTNAPGTWDWADVVALDCDHYPDMPVGGDIYTLETSKVEIRVGFNSTCSLTAPQRISRSHSRNVMMLNMWNGDREVYDFARSSKNMVLKGMEWGTDACTRIDCVRLMGRNGYRVGITGLNDDNLDTWFHIRSFGWKKHSECPLVYAWILELEFDDM